MKKLILPITLLVLFLSSCKQESKSLKNDFSSNEKDSLITLIFSGRTFKSDTLRQKTGEYSFSTDNISYTINSSFVSNILPKNNYKKNDTVVIHSTKSIILSHGYCLNQYSLYKFKPGDIVLFDYQNDYPICKILNRPYSDIDLNFMTRVNLKSKPIKDDFLFFMENRRLRNKEENKKVQLENKIILLNKENKFDSLKKSNSINGETYNLIKQDFNYSTTDITSKLDNVLTSDINLALPNGRKMLSNKFDSIYKPSLAKGGHSRFIDSRMQFDNLIKDQNISSKNRDFLLYKYMVEIITNFSSDDVNNYYKVFEKQITDKKIVELLNDKYLVDLNNNGKNKNTIPLIDGRKQKLELINLIKTKYKNKVIVIDFWASWCMPCRKAMPFSKQLRTEYKNKDVVFIYISVDKEFDKWEMASQKEGLFVDKNNFMALNYPNMLFYKEIQLNSIPRYLIYNKKGELVHKNAPSPDSKEIRTELNKYLSQ
jgi:thiol-disulfide isomerase/thioredoxin